jgi:hypothetical protein
MAPPNFCGQQRRKIGADWFLTVIIGKHGTSARM